MASNAFANPQPGALYDARSSGLAGAGVAFLDSGAASFHNPANMDKIGKSVTTLTFAPFLNELTAPIMPPGSTASGYQLAPLGQLGTAWRVHDRIVVGANLFAVAGAGIKYNNIPPGNLCNGGACSQQELFLQAELQIPISFKLTDELSVGVAYRMTYGMLTADLWAPGGGGSLIEEKLSASATNFKGVQVGVHYQPVPELELGVNYRSDVTLHWSGSFNVAGSDLPSDQASQILTGFNYTAPHTLSGGAALHLLDQTLLLTAEYRYFFYAHETAGLEQPAALQQPGQPAVHWQDAWTVVLAGEYKLCPQVPFRLGFSWSTEATTEATATPFGMPPGSTPTVSVGSGYDFGNWVADLAVAYAWYSHTIPTGAGLPGDYKLSSIEIFASGSYKF